MCRIIAVILLLVPNVFAGIAQHTQMTEGFRTIHELFSLMDLKATRFHPMPRRAGEACGT